MMKRGALLVVSAFLLGACALPVPVQFASWAIDGVSLITTHKSVADHGLSLIANEDCAMWRVVEGDNICSVNDAGSTAVADAGDPGELANFETAAGPEYNSPVFESPALPPLDERAPPGPGEYSLNHDPSEFADAWAYILDSSPPPAPTTAARSNMHAVGHSPHPVTASLSATASAGEPKITAWYPIEVAATVEVKPSKKATYAAVTAMNKPGGGAWPPVGTTRKSPDTNTIELKSGFYFVIGSFSKRDRAFRLAAKHTRLRPKVAISRMDGNEVNRVVVGPFAPGDKDAVHHRVRKDGIFDAWAARINSAKWLLSSPQESGDLAQLP